MLIIKQSKREECEKYRNMGYYISEIAEKMKMDPIEVFNIITGSNYTTQEEYERIMALHRAGISIAKIAEEIGKTPATIRYRINKGPVMLRDSKVRDTASAMKVLKALKKSKGSLNECNKYGNPRDEIKHRVRVAHIRTPRVQMVKITDKVFKQIKKLYNDGTPVKEIVLATGLARSTIYRVIKKF